MQAFEAFVAAQPNNVPFVFAYKGKYIVQVEKSTVGSPHVNAYYYVDNSLNLVDHDFEAGVPAAGQLTIEKTSHITPGSTAAFSAELRAFLESLGLANVGLQGGRAFNWYDAIAAYYEAITPITVVDSDGNSLQIVGRGEDLIDGEGERVLAVVDSQGVSHAITAPVEGWVMMADGGISDQLNSETSTIVICELEDTSINAPSNNWKLLFWLKDNNLWNPSNAVYVYDDEYANERTLAPEDASCSAGAESVKLVPYQGGGGAQGTYQFVSDYDWDEERGAYLSCSGTTFYENGEQGANELEFVNPSKINNEAEMFRCQAWNGIMLYLLSIVKTHPANY